MSVEANDDEHFAQIFEEKKSKPVILFFTAKWCGPCQLIKPLVEEQAEKLSDRLTVIKVDVDQCEDVAADYSINSMPTFLLVVDGGVKETLSGANSEKIQELFDKAIL